jgi:Xaa-Pro aminopeptidase
MNMPFQTFDEQSDASQCASRLAALRAELTRQKVDGFLVPRADEHQGEYVPKHAERLAWLTGFTGSAGIAAVLIEKAAVFVDGRYTLQVRNQTDTALFETLDVVNDGLQVWIEANLPKAARLGYDPWRCGLVSPSCRARAQCPSPLRSPAKQPHPNARASPRI